MTWQALTGAPSAARLSRYKDLRQHLADLERHSLLRHVMLRINEDTELHPLVRLQFLNHNQAPEHERRKAWLFEQEGPFGESHGYVHLRQSMPVLQVPAVTHRRHPIYSSFASQVTPSGSSTIKKVGYEPLFLQHLQLERGPRCVRRVAMTELLFNPLPMQVVQFTERALRRDVWRALYGVATFHTGVSKLVVGVSLDIDPHALHAVPWTMVSRGRFGPDLAFVEYMGHLHGPLEKQAGRQVTKERHLLVDAALEEPYPLVALPRREFMERALELMVRARAGGARRYAALARSHARLVE